MVEQLEDSINGIDAMSCIESWESINETPLDFQTPQPHLVCHEFSTLRPCWSICSYKNIYSICSKLRRVSNLKLGVTRKLLLEKMPSTGLEQSAHVIGTRWNDPCQSVCIYRVLSYTVIPNCTVYPPLLRALVTLDICLFMRRTSSYSRWL